MQASIRSFGAYDTRGSMPIRVFLCRLSLCQYACWGRVPNANPIPIRSKHEITRPRRVIIPMGWDRFRAIPGRENCMRLSCRTKAPKVRTPPLLLDL